MTEEKAMRSRGNSYASEASARDDMAIVAQCALFVLALMAVPTLMALGKCWGVW